MRQFETGATRDTDETKLDYEGFLSPLSLEAYAKYLHKHRIQADGKLRDSDNWQKGIPKAVYMKSMFRHFMEVWKLHREYPVQDPKTAQVIQKEEALCALAFNVLGYLHEVVKENV